MKKRILTGCVILAVLMAVGGCLKHGETKKPSIEDMVIVPAGEFTMGKDHYSYDEGPAHKVYLDAFFIDKYELTVQQYAGCVQAGKCSLPDTENTCNWGVSGKENHPINCVDWQQADTFCKWAGKRLPTEAEWEKAARGIDGRTYPWGEEADCSRAYYIDCIENGVDSGTKPVGSYPSGASPYGAMDMAGNVWEWVADWYKYNYYKKSPERNPAGPPPDDDRILRGGSWYYGDSSMQTFIRENVTPKLRAGGTGFRCAMYQDSSLPAPTPPPPPVFEESWFIPATPEQQKNAPSGMLYVPKGDFMMGCNETFDEGCEREENPYHKVNLDAFYIDKLEVTSKQYEACFDAGKCAKPKTSYGCNWKVTEKENHPINCVDWFQAEEYCKWAGKRLPTEAEWEKAARGTNGRVWPWGNDWDGKEYAAIAESTEFVDEEPTTYPVGSKPKGASPYGALDMIGNVWEWTSDWYDEYYYKISPESNPRGPALGIDRVMRGGSFDKYYGRSLRASFRGHFDPYERRMVVGFRCAQTP